MGGEIGKAGLGKRIDKLVRLDRLERLAKGGTPIAIVDRQSRAVVGDDPRGDAGHQAVGDSAQFEDCAGGASALM